MAVVTVSTSKTLAFLHKEPVWLDGIAKAMERAGKHHVWVCREPECNWYGFDPAPHHEGLVHHGRDRVQKVLPYPGTLLVGII